MFNNRPLDELIRLKASAIILAEAWPIIEGMGMAAIRSLASLMTATGGASLVAAYNAKDSSLLKDMNAGDMQVIIDKANSLEWASSAAEGLTGLSLSGKVGPNGAIIGEDGKELTPADWEALKKGAQISTEKAIETADILIGDADRLMNQTPPPKCDHLLKNIRLMTILARRMMIKSNVFDIPHDVGGWTEFETHPKLAELNTKIDDAKKNYEDSECGGLREMFDESEYGRQREMLLSKGYKDVTYNVRSDYYSEFFIDHIAKTFGLTEAVPF